MSILPNHLFLFEAIIIANKFFSNLKLSLKYRNLINNLELKHNCNLMKFCMTFY